MPAESEDELLTQAEVAALLYVDPKTVTRWAAAGKLAAIHGSDGHRRYLRSEVLAIVSGLHPDRRSPLHHRGGSQGSVTVPGDDQDPTRAVTTGAERQATAATVVGEAVAHALERAAAEAAEAALVTSAAVTVAAGRAAAAAAGARAARAAAAEAAALSITLEAERTAGDVRDRAALAAAQVHDAAALAASELARCIEGGLEVDAEHLAALLASTVRAAADAMAEDTRQAATAVTDAGSAAAAQVIRTLAAAEELFEREVTTVADAQRELAAATAVAVVLETDARAASIAATAGEAAAALLTDELWARTVDVGADVGERDVPALEREDHTSDRARELTEILAAAAAMDRIYATTEGASAASHRSTTGGRPAPGPGPLGAGDSAAMSEAAAELSHDLRVPLTSIIASVEMLEDELRDHAGGSISALLGRATRAGDRMVRMLDQNMTPHDEFSPLARSEVDLAEVARQLVLDSSNLLESVGAVVEIEDLPVVHGDADALYSVLQNLLTNAVKFARPGVPARVRLSADRTDDGWRISVRDNGRGLPEQSGLDIFSLFSRGTSTVSGHGIGLATIARIVAAHGGRVGATRVPNGADVWFELPAGGAIG